MRFEPSTKKGTRKVTRAGSQPQGESQQALTRGSTLREESDGEKLCGSYKVSLQDTLGWSKQHKGTISKAR